MVTWWFSSTNVKPRVKAASVCEARAVEEAAAVDCADCAAGVDWQPPSNNTVLKIALREATVRTEASVLGWVMDDALIKRLKR